jgi:hypothetical protein
MIGSWIVPGRQGQVGGGGMLDAGPAPFQRVPSPSWTIFRHPQMVNPLDYDRSWRVERFRMLRRSLCAALAAGILAAASIAVAQQIWVGGRRGTPIRVAQAEDFDGRFIYCRVLYRGGWSTDYPGADHNFSVRLAELTRVRVKFDEFRNPHHVVVALTDPLLFRCPNLFMTNAGSGMFSSEEVERLREYFLKGGFLWVDDSWGSVQWSRWVSQISRVLPPGEFPMIDVPSTHPALQMLYNVAAVPQVPNINFWSSTGGATSERGWDSAEVYVKGIQDARGRLMVLTTHNTDISDTWEREGEEPQEFFNRFSPTGYAIGVNVVLYALTH